MKPDNFEEEEEEEEAVRSAKKEETSKTLNQTTKGEISCDETSTTASVQDQQPTQKGFSLPSKEVLKKKKEKPSKSFSTASVLSEYMILKMHLWIIKMTFNVVEGGILRKPT